MGRDTSMIKKLSTRLTVLATTLVVVVGCAAGYGALHVTGAASKPSRPATAGKGVAALNGTWVFKNTTTIETLRLRVDKKGAVHGDGSSTVKSTTNPHKSGTFSIKVHSGRLAHNTLTLALWVQQQFGYGVTEVENLRCAPTTRVQHCHMSVQIVDRVYNNIPQNFYRS